MQIDFFRNIERVASSERLNAYRHDGANEITTLSRYLWNIALCETLYSPLQMVEISLRNAMHFALTEKFNSATWYDLPKANLAEFGILEVQNAKRRLSGLGKQETPDRIVAELQFGFWTSLLEFHYERNSKYWPALAKAAFPGVPRKANIRKFLLGRLTNIRKLRNRVFHHERIVHWKDLKDRHGEIVETVGWISDAMQELCLRLDRFAETYQAGTEPWKEKIRSHWPESQHLSGQVTTEEHK